MDGTTLMKNPGAHAARSAASLAGLFAFTVGIPVVLGFEQGWQPFVVLAKVVRHPSYAVRAVSDPVTNATVLHVVLLLACVAWAWVAACLVVEVIGRVGGRPVARLPASRHAQALAALLVGASLALVPSIRPTAPMRITAGLSAIQSIDLADYSSPMRLAKTAKAGSGHPTVTAVFTSDGTPPVASKAPVEPMEHLYQVKPGDTLWSIAETQLGSPLLWREIAALNVGSSQPDGRTMEEAGWILPGWILHLPALGAETEIARSDPVRQTSTTPNKEDQITDTTSDLIHEATPSRTSGEPLHSNHDDPSAVIPTVTHSDARRTSDSVGRAQANGSSHLDPQERRPQSNRASSPGKETASRVAERKAASTEDARFQFPSAPFGYGLLGAGVVMVVNRLRRRQQRHRPEGRRIALPDSRLESAEMLLRASADNGAAEWVDCTLRILAASCRREQIPSPKVVALRLLDQSIELLLDPESSFPSPVHPFSALNDGRSWALSRRSETLEEARTDPWVSGLDVVSPAVVTIGRESQGLTLVDVEQAGSVGVTGDRADDILRAMAIELATSTWSEQVNIVLVGMEKVSFLRSADDSSLDALDRVRVADDIVEVLPELRHLTTERSVMLDAVGLDRTSEARLAVSGDGWDVTVLFCSSHVTTDNPRAIDDLLELSGDGSLGLVTIFAGLSEGARWAVNAAGGPVALRFAGLGGDSIVWPQTVTEDAAGQIAKLVDVARKLDGVDPIPPEGYVSVGGSTFRGIDPFEDDEPPPAIEILVLGPVEVLGAARVFTRAWSLELIVYLAMHPGGATSDQWATHLWPNRSMAPASLHSTASAARRALGSTATGEDHLPRSHGKLALGPGVSTDWDRFSRFARSPNPDAWRRALGLIRGRPFDGLRSTDWAVFSHVQANIESQVVDVAARRAEHCLSQEEPQGAEWAARRGLLVSPYDERLYRILMRAANLAGNPAGVEAAMTELLQLVGGEVEPYDSVHPETYELYRSLSRRHLGNRHQ
jgi:DNA-binding SARP family transcriptional activator/LysM repeat protein